MSADVDLLSILHEDDCEHGNDPSLCPESDAPDEEPPLMYSPEYEKRWQALHLWPKSSLVEQCGRYGIWGTSGGPYGLAGWSRHELEKAILRSEFPAEASNG